MVHLPEPADVLEAKNGGHEKTWAAVPDDDGEFEGEDVAK